MTPDTARGPRPDWGNPDPPFLPQLSLVPSMGTRPEPVFAQLDAPCARLAIG